MSFTVTAAQGGSTQAGMSMSVLVFTGVSSSQPGTLASQATASQNLSVTPAANGSYLAGSILGGNATVTAETGTTFLQTGIHTALNYTQFRDGGSTTSGVAETVGATDTTHGISVVAAEILASGTLAIDASTPSPTAFVSATSITSAAFSPPSGAYLVALVGSNGASSVTTMSVSDTSGLGLSWSELVKENPAGSGYTGVWGASTAVSSASAAVTGAAAASARMYGTLAAVYDAVISPPVPASGASLVNANRDAIVVITGGTLTGVSVEGASLGTPVTFAVPAYGSVTPSYTGTLTWQWVLLSSPRPDQL